MFENTNMLVKIGQINYELLLLFIYIIKLFVFYINSYQPHFLKDIVKIMNDNIENR